MRGRPEFVHRSPAHTREAACVDSTVSHLLNNELIELKDALKIVGEPMSASVKTRVRIQAAQEALDRIRKQQSKIIRNLKTRIRDLHEDLRYATPSESPVPQDAVDKARNAELVTCVHSNLLDFKRICLDTVQ